MWTPVDHLFKSTAHINCLSVVPPHPPSSKTMLEEKLHPPGHWQKVDEALSGQDLSWLL